MLNSCRVCSTRIREFTNDRSLINAVSSYIWAVIGQSASRAIQWCNRWSLWPDDKHHNQHSSLYFKRMSENGARATICRCGCRLYTHCCRVVMLVSSVGLPCTKTDEHLELPILADVSGCVVDGAHETAEVAHSGLPIFIRSHLALLCTFKVDLGLFC